MKADYGLKVQPLHNSIQPYDRRKNNIGETRNYGSILIQSKEFCLRYTEETASEELEKRLKKIIIIISKVNLLAENA